NRRTEGIEDMRLAWRQRDAGFPRRRICVAALEIRQRQHGAMIIRVRDPKRGLEEAARAACGAADDGDHQIAIGVCAEGSLSSGEEQERENDSWHRHKYAATARTIVNRAFWSIASALVGALLYLL